MTSKISVIVPVYNCERTIGKCLDSLVNQTYKNIEIIVVNDGSTDGSRTILEEYSQRYRNIKVFTKKNGGIADVRNYGLLRATGEYIGFLDGDDYTSPDMFEKMMAKAMESDADIVVSNFKWVSSKNTKIEKEGPYAPGKDMLIHLFATLWNKIYKKKFIDSLNIQFPVGNRYEDAYFLYCIAPFVNKIAFVDESFVSYVQHSTSITHTNNSQVKNMITIFEHITDWYHQHGIYEKYQSELEYLHIKFFLGNSFLRSALIDDKKDRHETIDLGWNLLQEKFPSWTKNHYLKDIKSFKHYYFRSVRSWNIYGFAWIFRHLKRDNL